MSPPPPSLLPPPAHSAPQAQPGGGTLVHEGMPPLEPGPLYPSFKRRLSDPVFYVVPALMWAALAIRNRSLTLPTVANPAMEVGGLWGESKAQCLSIFGPRARAWVAPYVRFERSPQDPGAVRDLAALRERLSAAGLAYPLVAKPDRGYQGWGVKLVRDEAQVADYLAALPPGAGLILQAHVPYGGEAGLFYLRCPGTERGSIVSLALTYAPHVVGDGHATLEDLVRADCVLRKSADIYRPCHAAAWRRVVPAGEVVVLTNARSARVGAVYRDARHLVTPALEERIEDIARDIDGFHFGRFDLRFESLERLQAGEGFRILELNGAGGEMLHLWDGRTSLGEAYRTLWRQYRKLFAISARNARLGYRPSGLWHMIRLQMRQEKLRRGYPPST